MPWHNRITGIDAAHPIGNVGTTDPASVAANDVQARSTWLDTTDEGTTGILLKIRNAANNAWSSVKVAYAAAVPWSGVTGITGTPNGAKYLRDDGAWTAIAQSEVTSLTTDLAAKAPLASPALTGTPTAPTAATSTNTTQLATTAFVQQELAAVGGVSDLDDLSDAAVSSPEAGQVLVYDGTNFANRHPSPLNSQSGTSYTLVIGDTGKYVRCSNAGAITLTVPPNSSVAFPVGTEVHVEQAAAGAVTLTPGSGVTISVHADFTLVTDGQYAVATMKKVATDTWVAFGKLVAAP
jgi:hypothetical protein